MSERTVHEAHPPLPYPNSGPIGVGHRRFFVCSAMQCSLEDGVVGVGNNGCVGVGLCGFERRYGLVKMVQWIGLFGVVGANGVNGVRGIVGGVVSVLSMPTDTTNPPHIELAYGRVEGPLVGAAHPIAECPWSDGSCTVRPMYEPLESPTHDKMH